MEQSSVRRSQQEEPLGELVGRGTFGSVYLQRDGEGRKVAVKQVLQNKNYKNRELKILQMLKHPNVIAVRDSYFSTKGGQQYLNVAMDYYPTDLSRVIRRLGQERKQPGSQFVRQFFRQMLLALDYLAESNICHRDIKPSNILLTADLRHAVICDFGSAKVLDPSEPNLSYICSRTYRAPELLFESTNYTTAIDMWSLACVVAELLAGRALFTGSSNLDQCCQIIKVLGTPTSGDVQAMNPLKLEEHRLIPEVKGRGLARSLRKCEGTLLCLLEQILVYNPKRRLRPSQALEHDYFKL